MQCHQATKLCQTLVKFIINSFFKILGRLQICCCTFAFSISFCGMLDVCRRPIHFENDKKRLLHEQKCARMLSNRMGYIKFLFFSIFILPLMHNIIAVTREKCSAVGCIQRLFGQGAFLSDACQCIAPQDGWWRESCERINLTEQSYLISNRIFVRHSR